MKIKVSTSVVPIDDKFYKENGYLVYKHPVFSQEKFSRLVNIFQQLQVNNQDGTKSQQGRHSLDTPHFYVPELLEFLMSDEVLDLVEPLIGSDIALWSSHFINKEPYTGKATPWHEDSAYWKGRFDNYDKIVTLWLALDSTDHENGALKIIPKSHHHGFSNYHETSNNDFIFSKGISQIDETDAVTLLLEPNQCSMHDGRIIHGAGPNRSSRRRCGYTMRYFSQSLKFNIDHPMNKGFKIWHCRGKNMHDNPVEN